VTAATSAPFSRRAIAWLAGVGGACLVASIVVLVATNRPPATRAGSDSTNPSAFGHSAFVDLLRDVSVPVIVARARTVERTSGASLLLLIEPTSSSTDGGSGELDRMIEESACPVLVVLPKWRVVEREGALGTETFAMRRAAGEVDRVLQAFDRRASSSTHPDPEWKINAFRTTPKTQRGCQLVTGSSAVTVAGGGSGAFVVETERDDRMIGVVADPDVFANHGLHHPENARLALAIVDRFRDGDGPVIIDETLHGLGTFESFWARIFQFPLVIATIQAAIAAAILLLSGAFRFGAPAPPEPPYPPGKRFLIDHVAGLLEAGRHHGVAALRYLALVREDVDRSQIDRVDGPRHANRALPVADETFAALAAEVRRVAAARPHDAQAAHQLALRLWRWKQEKSDGSR
jgi:hypothetical protein